MRDFRPRQKVFSCRLARPFSSSAVDGNGCGGHCTWRMSNRPVPESSRACSSGGGGPTSGPSCSSCRPAHASGESARPARAIPVCHHYPESDFHDRCSGFTSSRRCRPAHLGKSNGSMVPIGRGGAGESRGKRMGLYGGEFRKSSAARKLALRGFDCFVAPARGTQEHGRIARECANLGAGSTRSRLVDRPD